MASLLWLAAALGYGGLAIVQLGLTGEYVAPDVLSAGGNGLVTVACVILAIWLRRRPGRRVRLVSIGIGICLALGGLIQMIGGLAGLPLVAATTAGGLAALATAVSEWRAWPGRTGRVASVGMRPAATFGHQVPSNPGTVPSVEDDPWERFDRRHQTAVPRSGKVPPNLAERGPTPEPKPPTSRSSRVRGPSTRITILGLVLAALVAALVVDRFSGLDGPWLWNYDIGPIGFPLASWLHKAVSSWSIPLWNDHIAMGFPLYADGSVRALYPPDWLIFQLPPLIALDVERVLHLALAGVGAGLITLRLSGSRIGAVATVVLAVMCGAIVSKLSFTMVVPVYGWMPWVLLPLLWRRAALTGGFILLAGLIWGIQALAGHPPYWLLTGLMAILVILLRSGLRTGALQVFRFGLVAGGIGAMQLVPTLLLTSLSVRGLGLDPATLFRFSATPFDFLGVGFANALAPAASPAWNLTSTWYPGSLGYNITEAYAYVGLPALALAAVGLDGRRVRVLAAVCVLAIVIPIIGSFQPTLWTQIPILNGMRHPVRAYLLLDLAVAIAAGVGLARLRRAQSVRPSVIVVGLMAGGYAAITLLAATPGLFDSAFGAIWPAAGETEQHRITALSTLTQPWPLAFEAACTILVLGVLRVRRWLPAGRLAAAVLVILPVATLVAPFNESLPSSAFSMDQTPLVKTIHALAPHRVVTVNVPFYNDFPDELDAGFADLYNASSLALESATSLLSIAQSDPGNPIVRASGVDTEIVFGRDCISGQPVGFDPTYNATICHLDGSVRAPYWLPSQVVTAGERRSNPLADATSPVDASVDPASALAIAVPAAVESWEDAAAVVISDQPSAGYMFIDRSWYPTWRITVDGVPVSASRVFGGQLVPVPAGRHTIEEHIVPWDLGIGALVTAATLASLAAWWAVHRRRSRLDHRRG